MSREVIVAVLDGITYLAEVQCENEDCGIVGAHSHEGVNLSRQGEEGWKPYTGEEDNTVKGKILWSPGL